MRCSFSILDEVLPLNMCLTLMIADLLLTRSTRRSTIIKVKLLFNGSTLERMEKEHLTKLAPAS